MAQSVKIDFNPWTQFDHHLYNIINEDFVHDKLFRINANIVDTKGIIRLRETLLKQKSFNQAKKQ